MRYTVIDIETTGISIYSEDIVQFAAAVLDENLVPVKTDSFLLWFDGMKWGEEAEKIHGFTPKDCQAYAKDYDDNLRKIAVYCSNGNLVGHNIERFDYPFIVNYMLRHGFYYRKEGTNFTSIHANTLIDTLKMFRPIVKRLYENGDPRVHDKKADLVGLMPKLGISEQILQFMENMYFGKVTHAHSASYDVCATIALLQYAKNGGYWHV